jgi:hypothetical protein
VSLGLNGTAAGKSRARGAGAVPGVKFGQPFVQTNLNMVGKDAHCTLRLALVEALTMSLCWEWIPLLSPPQAILCRMYT